MSDLSVGLHSGSVILFENGGVYSMSPSEFSDIHNRIMESIPIGATGFCNLEHILDDMAVYSFRIFHNGGCDKASPDTSFVIHVVS